jgi:hypothetical protein
MCGLRAQRSFEPPHSEEVDMDPRLSQQLMTIRQTEALERGAAARAARRQVSAPRRAPRLRTRLAARFAR